VVNENPLAAMTPAPRQESADMNDPRQHAAWALVCFPSPNKQMPDIPLAPPVPADLSELLWHFGYRQIPHLQTKWYVPGDHPEAAFLNTPKLVDRAEYEKYLAEHGDPEQRINDWRGAAEELLAKIAPREAARIAAMNDEEKAAELASRRQHMPPAFQRLAELNEDLMNNGGENE
jgi:hypothetical protein